MLTSKLRSQLAGFANKPRLYSRVFSTAPVSRLPIDLVKAVEGKVDLGWTPEIVTMEGINRVAAYDSHIPTCEAKRFVRGIASLKAGTAHNCRLIYTMEILECLPRQGYGDFQLQAITAREIIGHHQQRALHRAGIFVRYRHYDQELDQVLDRLTSLNRTLGLFSCTALIMNTPNWASRSVSR
jgi:hypothetical protein